MNELKKKIILIMLILVSVLIGMMACGKMSNSEFVDSELAEELNITEVNTEDKNENMEQEETIKNEVKLEKDDKDTDNQGNSSLNEPNINSENNPNNNENGDKATGKENTIVYTYRDFSKTMYATGTVNVRILPSASGEKVGLLYEGQMVEVTGQCNETNWYRINHNGSCAYVSNNYLTEELEVNPPDESWVKDLDIAQTTTQIIVVAAKGTHATVSMHTKDENGIWNEDFSVAGRVGKNGIGKTKEGDGKTPIGVFKFNKAFGILSNPGITSIPYLQVDETHHWVDDSNSKYYNQCVSTRDVQVDWNSSEHLFKVVPQYNYALSLNYNEECIPNAGSAIFLHCTSKSFGTTAGCIAIPEKYMMQVMQYLRSDCIIIIDSTANVYNY